MQGVSWVKWLRRIELSDQPFMTREETSKYTDPLPDGTARIWDWRNGGECLHVLSEGSAAGAGLWGGVWRV